MKVWGWRKTDAGGYKKESDHSYVGSRQEGRSKYEASVGLAVEAEHPSPSCGVGWSSRWGARKPEVLVQGL